MVVHLNQHGARLGDVSPSSELAGHLFKVIEDPGIQLARERGQTLPIQPWESAKERTAHA